MPVVFELNLASNNIHNVTVKAFEGLLQLLVLNLKNNNLTRIPNGAFTGALFSFQTNLITIKQIELISGLVSLRTLDLSGNRIERIDNRTHGLLDDCLSLDKVSYSTSTLTFI